MRTVLDLKLHCMRTVLDLKLHVLDLKLHVLHLKLCVLHACTAVTAFIITLLGFHFASGNICAYLHCVCVCVCVLKQPLFFSCVHKCFFHR